jgi:hypothetical protein
VGDGGIRRGVGSMECIPCRVRHAVHPPLCVTLPPLCRYTDHSSVSPHAMADYDSDESDDAVYSKLPPQHVASPIIPIDEPLGVPVGGG